ncbi:DUF6221 family protein [Streptomyces sp. NPDC059456]|uniref:DUF6221 family protein n=1 Tax=Streptomyces sp. NPDC059456 TaxID=3346838 RepID=UPI0036AF6E94
MKQDLATFLRARLDEEADLARRCDGEGCREWTAHGHTVDFCQGELSGIHPTIALHVALHNLARVLRAVNAPSWTGLAHARDLGWLKERR